MKYLALESTGKKTNLQAGDLMFVETKEHTVLANFDRPLVGKSISRIVIRKGNGAIDNKLYFGNAERDLIAINIAIIVGLNIVKVRKENNWDQYEFFE